MRAFCLRFSPLCLCFAVLLPHAPARAQAPAPHAPATPLAADYSKEPVYIVSLANLHIEHEDGTSVREQAMVVKVQSDAALRQLGVLSVPFAGKSEDVEFLYARVRRPDGTTVETPVDDALEEAAPITREAPFYSDIKQKELPVRSLRVGDTLEWKVRITRKVPEAPHEFWGEDTFTSEGIVLSETMELHVPATRHVLVWTNKIDGPPPVESTENGEHIYKWTHANLKLTVGAEAEKGRKAEEKHVLTADEELNNEQGRLPSLAFTTFESWAAVGDWYRGLERDRIVPEATVKAKVAELTAGLATDDTRARALYTYVATQIRYIGVALGVGRYQPHSAADVLANQYGDCKDKHTLLAAMFTAAGLQSDAVLIGYGIRFNPDVPTPQAFNHLITHLKLDGKYVWLDTTAEVAPWSVLFPQIRDEPALVVPDAGSATIARTPDGLPFPASFHANITGSLNPDFTSESTINLTYRDDDELMLRAALRQVTAAQYGAVTQRIMVSYGFGGTTSDPDFKHLADISEPLTLAFHYERIHNPEWGTNRVTIPFITFSIPGVDPNTPATSTIRLGVPRTETTTVDVTLPPGWNGEVPEAVHAKSAFALCDTTYRIDTSSDTHLESKGPTRVFHAERRLTVLQAKVPTSQWPAYKKWYEDAEAGSVPYLQLVHISGGKGDRTARTFPVTGDPGNGGRGNGDGSAPARPERDGSLSPPPAGATAESLVEQAREQLRDPLAARKLLDQARSLNPEERGLWTGYAGVAYMLGMPGESIDDIYKELGYHPDEVQLYNLLAQQQRSRGDSAAALATLQKWADAAPDSPDAATALVTMYTALDRNADATASGRSALTSLTKANQPAADLSQLRLALGRAEMADGHRASAVATVRPLLDLPTDTLITNNAAYLLADASPNGASPALALAESKQREVLDQLSSQTATWTLDESPQVLHSKTSLLVAAWDTMGWILFREGKPAEARPLIAAATRNRPDPETLGHLQAADAALHGKAAPAAPERQPMHPIDPAHPQRPSPGLLAQSEADQSNRTFALGPANGRHGTAELRLLLAEGKVVRATPVASNEITGAPQMPAELSAPRLADAATLATKANLQPLFPAISDETAKAQLVRTAILNCSGETCSMILEPL